jgi:hypothetical protein
MIKLSSSGSLMYNNKWTQNHLNPPITRYTSKYFPPIHNKDSIDWQAFEKKYNESQLEMEEYHKWFEDGRNYNFLPAKHKNIALGRAQFYLQFMDFYYERYGRRLYLLDYMLRIDSAKNGMESLLYFIEDADEIHINLEGIKPAELHCATVGLNRLTDDKNEIGAPHTTAWEINQVFHKGLLPITWFHTGSSMSRTKAWFAIGKKVPFNRILNDNKHLIKEWKQEKKFLNRNEEIQDLEILD